MIIILPPSFCPHHSAPIILPTCGDFEGPFNSILNTKSDKYRLVLGTDYRFVRTSPDEALPNATGPSVRVSFASSREPPSLALGSISISPSR